MTNPPIKRRNGKGQFSKGTSGNSAGRPPGSRNKSTLLMEGLFAEHSERLTQKAIELALKDNVHALRLCLERIHPPCKERFIQLDLPPIQNIEHLPLAMATVFEAIAEGQITPGEGEILANVLAVQNEVVATSDLQRRIEHLEEKISNNKKELDNQTSDIGHRLREGRTLTLAEPKITNERADP